MECRRRWRALMAAAVILASGGFVCRDDEPGDPVWPNWGGDLRNTHHAAGEVAISPDTVHRLRPRWVVRTTGNVSAIPAVTTSRLYFPDWGIPNLGGGSLYTVDRATGEVVARKPVTDYSKHLLHTV